MVDFTSEKQASVSIDTRWRTSINRSSMGKKRLSHNGNSSQGGDTRKRQKTTYSGLKQRRKVVIDFDPSTLSNNNTVDGDNFFFELANADLIRFKCSGGTLLISQDRDIRDIGKEGQEGVLWS